MQLATGINRRHRRAQTAFLRDLRINDYDGSRHEKAAYYLHASICRCLQLPDTPQRARSLRHFLAAQSESENRNVPPATPHA